MDQYNETNAKYNAQAAYQNQYPGGAALQGGLAGSGQIGIQTAETLQLLSAENANKMKRVNEQLALLRSRLFGEAESCAPPASNTPTPMPSLGISLATANEELLEAFRQLDSLVKRV